MVTRPPGAMKWATDALDHVRREVWNHARRAGMKEHAQELKGSRYALWKNPEDLTERQQAKLAWIAAINKRLFRAYLLKEQLRAIIRLKGPQAIEMLTAWLAWASRSKLPAFVELARKIRKNRPGILKIAKELGVGTSTVQRIAAESGGCSLSPGR